jgi:hypothetical protein
MTGLPVVPGLQPEIGQLRGILNHSLLRRGIDVLGVKLDGTTLSLRFRAPYSVPWVQVHVQSTAAGKGGMTYDAANYVSTTEVDCRSDRVQDITVSSMTLSDQYIVFLIPVQYDGAGTKILYDGAGGRPDDKSFVATLTLTEISGFLTATGGAFSDDIYFTADSKAVRTNTSDGSDNRRVLVSGGGAANNTRGSYLEVHGNEYSGEPGYVILDVGNVASSVGELRRAGTAGLRWTDTIVDSLVIHRFGAPARLKGYTVATLPGGTVGDTAYVTDALAPAHGAVVAAGGAVVIPVFYNGANWIVA